MKIFRNREIKIFLFIYLFFTIAASGAASFISVWAVLLAVVICTASVLLFLLFTRTRYQAISDLSVQVDRILHGDYNVNLIPDEEGELAVLGSELSKMTLRLRDQTDRLEKEKLYLSDSLADISHQLRTPLTSIRMIVSRLASEDLSVEQQRTAIKSD